MRQLVFIIFILLLSHNCALAEYCTEIGKRCVDGPSTKVIDKFEVHQECWQYETIYECLTSEYIDYCSGIKTAPGCEQISSVCKENGQDGQCLEYIEKYQCGNLLKDAEGVKFLESEYTVTKDTLDTKECDSNKINPNCQEVENVCVEGMQTRNINGKEITKNCWKYEKKYSCFVGSLISDCDEYKNKCALVGETCLNKAKDGSCRHTEKKYECMKVTGNMPVAMNCKTTKYCIGGDCEEVKHEPNKNIGYAASALSILSNLKNDFSEEECKSGASACNVFKGESQECRINPIGIRNCCKDSGWLKDLGIVGCSSEEKQLGKKKEVGQCHYVGAYCSKKDPLGLICLETTKSYCCFNSKLARIIHEQGRGQLGISWGSAESPNCQPLTIEQLQKIDFNRVDLREFYSDSMANFKIDKHNNTKGIAQAKVYEESLKVTKTKIKKEAISSAGAKEYQDEITRRVDEHYGK